MTPRLFIIILITFFFFSCHKEQHVPSDQSNFFEAIHSDSALQLEVITNLQALIEDRSMVYQNAQIHLLDAEGNSKSLQAQLKVRGNTRKRICDFPPLKLKLAEEDLDAHNWNKELDTYKIVTDCIGQKDLVAKELLVYQMYNLLTEKSFRVQPLEITYVDSRNPQVKLHQFGFLIESKKALAQRLAAKSLPSEIQSIKRVDAAQYQKLTVFQYMIGNTDWNLGRSHNIKYIQLTDKNVPSPIPYDFDYAGLVDAPYAIPHPNLPIQDVKERFFQWRGSCSKGLGDLLKQVNTQKDNMLDLCQHHPWLSDLAKEETVDYLNSFFQIVEEATQYEGKELVSKLKNQNKPNTPA